MRELLDRGLVGFDLDAEDVRPLAAIDGENAVRRNVVDRFAEVEVVAELAVLLLIVDDLAC